MVSEEHCCSQVVWCWSESTADTQTLGFAGRGGRELHAVDHTLWDEAFHGMWNVFRVPTTGNLLEFEIADGNTGSLVEFS